MAKQLKKSVRLRAIVQNGFIRHASRYNHSGESGLGERRHQNQGKEPLLDDLQLAYLWQR